MRQGRKSDGFFLCFLINFAFRFRWAFLIVILLILHFLFNFPLWLIFIPLGLWIIHAFMVTLVLFLGNKAGNIDYPQKDNVNPYSKKNGDYEGFE